MLVLLLEIVWLSQSEPQLNNWIGRFLVVVSSINSLCQNCWSNRLFSCKLELPICTDASREEPQQHQHDELAWVNHIDSKSETVEHGSHWICLFL